MTDAVAKLFHAVVAPARVIVQLPEPIFTRVVDALIE